MNYFILADLSEIEENGRAPGCNQHHRDANNQHVITMKAAARGLPFLNNPVKLFYEEGTDVFWSQVNMEGPLPDQSKESYLGLGNCWEWLGRKNHHGYGRIALKGMGASHMCHRVSWAMTRGEVREGDLVLHKCDNRICCNPEHLFIGTHRDNSKDMQSKGRSNIAFGDRHGTKTRPESVPRGDNHYTRIRPDLALQGVKNPAAKLGEHEVSEIIMLLDQGKQTQTNIAKAYRVSKSTISLISKGKRWNHIRNQETKSP